MQYTITIKYLVPFQNDEFTFTQEIDPKSLGALVRGMAKKLVKSNVTIVDDKGRECATIKRRRLGFHEYPLRELTLNGNLIHQQA